MFKINQHWIMIQRKPVAYASAIGILFVTVCMGMGFIQMPSSWRVEVLPRLTEMEIRQDKQMESARAEIENVKEIAEGIVKARKFGIDI